MWITCWLKPQSSMIQYKGCLLFLDYECLSLRSWKERATPPKKKKKKLPHIVNICAHCYLPTKTSPSTFALDSTALLFSLTLLHQLSTFIKLTHSCVCLCFSLEIKNKPPQTSHPTSALAPSQRKPNILEGCLPNYVISVSGVSWS